VVDMGDDGDIANMMILLQMIHCVSSKYTKFPLASK